MRGQSTQGVAQSSAEEASVKGASAPTDLSSLNWDAKALTVARDVGQAGTAVPLASLALSEWSAHSAESVPLGLFTGPSAGQFGLATGQFDP